MSLRSGLGFSNSVTVRCLAETVLYRSSGNFLILYFFVGFSRYRYGTRLKFTDNSRYPLQNHIGRYR